MHSIYQSSWERYHIKRYLERFKRKQHLHNTIFEPRGEVVNIGRPQQTRREITRGEWTGASSELVNSQSRVLSEDTGATALSPETLN